MNPVPDSEPNPGQTIDALSATTGVPSRTIRFYQSKGVLPPPQKKGRVAFYGPEHSERLELIGQLQDRGLRIDAIRALLTRIDRGEVDLGEWLGLEAQLTASWAGDHPRTVNESELLELLGSKRPGLIADLVRAKVVKRTGDVYQIRSPALLQIALRLEAVGVDLDSALNAEVILRKHLGKAAREVASAFFALAEKGEVVPPDHGDWSRVLAELRPTAMEAVRVVFGQEMERVLREHVESGKTAKLPVRRTRRG